MPCVRTTHRVRTEKKEREEERTKKCGTARSRALSRSSTRSTFYSNPRDDEGKVGHQWVSQFRIKADSKRANLSQANLCSQSVMTMMMMMMM